jgi:D-alanyl-D-alanine carboxypeptidase (penicillin-binding protein 5/6)
MVPGRNSKYTYEGLDGLKTGHTQAAKYCFTGTAQRGDLRLISVVMGAETEGSRFTETKKLLDYGFNNFEYSTLVKGKDQIPGAESAPIVKGVEKTVPAAAEKSLGLAVRKGEEDQYTYEVAWDKEALVAPIAAGQVLGKATIFYKDKNLGLSVSIIAQEDVEKASWIRLLFRAIGEWFGSIFGSVKGD